MSNTVKLSIGLAAIFLAVVIIFVNFSIPHLWRSVGKAEYFSANGLPGTAEIYKSRNGDLLFSIKESPEEVYIFSPTTKLVGIPNGEQFMFIPYFAYSKDVPVPVVFSSSRVRSEADMKITVEGSKVTFTTLKGRRIEADLSN